MLFKNYLKSTFAYILSLSLNTVIGLCSDDTENYQRGASFTQNTQATFPQIEFNPVEYTEKKDTWDFDIMLLRERNNPNTVNYLDLLADVAIQSESQPTPNNPPYDAETNLASTQKAKKHKTPKAFTKKNTFKKTLSTKSNNKKSKHIIVTHEESSKSLTISALSSMKKNQNEALNIYTRQLGTRIKRKTKLFSLSSTKGKTYIFE